jgi:hypothetical protein
VCAVALGALALSRFTDPGAAVAILHELPADPWAIASVARNQTIHHNLLPHFGIPRDLWPSLPRARPPRLDAVLRGLAETEPHTLSEARRPEQRVVSACVLESHFLAGLLRRRGHRVRVRVGYFQNIRGNAEHVVAFWEQVMREKGVEAELLARDPDQWRETVNAYSRHQNAVDHHIEHWICELWDDEERRWRLLDANDEFLRAHSALEVDFFLAPEYFEHAHEGWLRVRSGQCDPDQYREDEQDGRSHARSQLLWEFASLLNHDAAGIDDPAGRDYAFIKRQTYAQTAETELRALDELAALLADGRIDDLPDFYHATPTLRFEGAERDQHSLVYNASGRSATSADDRFVSSAQAG